MKVKIVFMSLLWLLIVSCDKQPVMGNFTIWKLDPTSAQKMNLSQLVDSISLVPLETNDTCLIKRIYSIECADDKIYVNNNQTDIQVYDNTGNFLYGTKEYLGLGPNDYKSVVSFRVLENDTIEVFDAISYEMRYFVYPVGFVSSYKIPKDILPAYQYAWLNKDTCVFSDGATENPTLKIYSKGRDKIIKKIEDKQKNQFVKTSNTLYYVNDKLYFSPSYPSNELYVLNDRLNKELILQLDFGQYNFSMKNLPKDLDAKAYSDYIFTHSEYAYPYSKYVLGDLFISYFQFDDNLYVAYMNKVNGKNAILKNEVGSYSQFMIPHYVQEDKFYYASEPGYLPYLVDSTLMNRAEIDKMKHVGEMDNPIIVIYKLKNR